MNILWRSSVGAEAVDEALLPSGSELRIETDRERARGSADWAHVLVDGRPDEALLDGTNLERVVVPYAGIAEKLQSRLAQRPHLKLHNSHFNAAFVAQHAVALLLAVVDRVVEAHIPLARGDWRPRYDDAFESISLDGRRCLLVGYGAVGREIAGRVTGLGMDLAAVRRTPPAGAEIPTYPADRLIEAMADSDVAILSLPLTDETRGMIGREALEALGPQGVIVNVGRGEVIDEVALYDVLKQRNLFGAGLDVWWRYPEATPERAMTFPSKVPLHDLPTVVMSPHRANQMKGWASASFADVARTLCEAAEGRDRNLVDPKRGY